MHRTLKNFARHFRRWFKYTPKDCPWTSGVNKRRLNLSISGRVTYMENPHVMVWARTMNGVGWDYATLTPTKIGYVGETTALWHLGFLR